MHGITAVCVPVLLVTGAEILAHHPELYWGETGFFGDPAALSLGAAETSLGLGFALGAARSVHFSGAWLLAGAWALHLTASLASGHLRRDLWPARPEIASRPLLGDILSHIAPRRHVTGEAYNTLQKLAYLAVLLVLVPVAILTGLAMSPAVTAAYPELITLFGGRQSARTIHFLVAVALLLFLVLHVTMVLITGPRRLIGGMLTGWVTAPAVSVEPHRSGGDRP